MVLLGLVGVGLAADAELIKLPFDLPFDFIKKSQPTQETTVDNSQSSQVTITRPTKRQRPKSMLYQKVIWFMRTKILDSNLHILKSTVLSRSRVLTLAPMFQSDGS